MKMNMPPPEKFIYKLTEKNLRDFLNEYKSNAETNEFIKETGFPFEVQMMNDALADFVIELKDTYENQKKIWEVSGNTFVPKLKFYSLINRVVDDIYPEFNPEWEHQKKYSRYRDPDDMLLMF